MRLVEHQSAWQQQKSGESQSANSGVYIVECRARPLFSAAI